jgi:hypothetical protein
MSEVNLTDKISETISIAFKKSKVFEKIEKFEMYFGSFLLISTVAGLTCIAINVITGFKVDNIKKEIEGNERVLKYNIEINRKRNSIEHCSLNSEILILNKQLSLLLENQDKLINQLGEIKLIKKTEENMLSINILKNDYISDCSSITTLSPIKNQEILDNNCNTIKDQDYDELLHECYDNIPMNNCKKNTGKYWLFK